MAQPAGRVSGAGLGLAQHHERHPGVVQQLRHGAGGPLRLVVEGTRAADPEEVVDVVRDPLGTVGLDDAHLERQAGRPLQPGARTPLPHGSPACSRLRSIGSPPRRELRLHQHLVAAHVDDVVDVLDVDRALLDAGAAGDAGPQHVGVDDAVDVVDADQRPLRLGARCSGSAARSRRIGQQVGRLGQRVVAQAHDQQLRATAASRCSRPGTATGSGRTRCRWRSRAGPSR